MHAQETLSFVDITQMLIGDSITIRILLVTLLLLIMLIGTTPLLFEFLNYLYGE